MNCFYNQIIKQIFKMEQNHKETCLKTSMKHRVKRTEHRSCRRKTIALNLDEKRLHRSIATNNTDAVHDLLKQGVNPNASDFLQRSPLHIAACRGFKEIISLLVEYGADPNQRDIMGNTALHLAACTNKIEIVTVLLDAGTDINSVDLSGRNPLQLAQSKLQLLQKTRRAGAVELVQLRIQLQQIIDLMLSFLRRRQSNIHELERLELNLNESTDSQLDDKVSLLLSAIENISIK